MATREIAAHRDFIQTALTDAHCGETNVNTADGDKGDEYAVITSSFTISRTNSSCSKKDDAYVYEEEEEGNENSCGSRVRVDENVSRNEHGYKVESERESPLAHEETAQALLCIDGRLADPVAVKRKIPRPANAFMLFANEWRKKLAADNPRESNKDISVRLGILWKNMTKDVKEKYFALAREVDAEHKRKYPDYVYNPKEARLRKAMREQNRDLSRRSILQSAIASANTRPAGSSVSVSVSGGFLERHHHHRFGCVTAATTVSSVPVAPPTVDPHRINEPWFQSAAHRAKAVHPGRPTTDWYGSIEGDPMERLQTMGAMHQRNLEKSAKDAMRKQAAAAAAATAAAAAAAAECAAAFTTTGYAADFAGGSREREARRQEAPGDYPIAEFADGQKWHPYQNGASPHSHARTAHPQAPIAGMLRSNVPNATSHGHGPAAWGQFCHGAMPHVPAVLRNVGIRGPRHAVFLRDRLTNRYCGFPDEPSRSPYVPGKIEVDGVRLPYQPQDHQMPRLLEPSVDSSMEPTQTTMSRRDEDDGPRWEQNSIPAGMSLDGLVSTSTQQEACAKREKERDTRRPSERYEAAKKRPSCKTPLPGFHQAFGSTEIGRFSRSEFFVNMVGESGGGLDVGDTTEVGNPIPEAYPTTPMIFPFHQFHEITENGEYLSRMIPEHCCWFATQSKGAVSRMPNNVLLHCPRHPIESDWLSRNGSLTRPLDIQALLRHQNGEYATLVNEHEHRNYVVIGAGCHRSDDNDNDNDEEESNGRRRSGIYRRSSFQRSSDDSPPVVHRSDQMSEEKKV